MIHFDRVDEPADFKEKAKQPGRQWLAENPQAKRPKDLWSPFKPALADGFHNLCAYGALYEPVGTVDHFLSCKNFRERADDWGNYRFASAWINSSKGDKEVLDPFEVEDDWFEILLPSLQLVVTDRIPTALRTKAERTLEILHLRDDERIVRQRREWYRMWEEEELSLEGLRKKAPLLARAIERQNRLT